MCCSRPIGGNASPTFDSKTANLLVWEGHDTASGGKCIRPISCRGLGSCSEVFARFKTRAHFHVGERCAYLVSMIEQLLRGVSCEVFLGWTFFFFSFFFFWKGPYLGKCSLDSLWPVREPPNGTDVRVTSSHRTAAEV